MRMSNSLAFWLAFSEKIRSGQNEINSVTPKVLVSLSYMWTAHCSTRRNLKIPGNGKSTREDAYLDHSNLTYSSASIVVSK